MTKILNIATLLFLVIGFTSCKTTKNQSSYQNNGKYLVIDNSTDRSIAFNEAFFEGLKAALVEENTDKAIDKFQECIAREPKSAGARYQLAKLYLRQLKIDYAVINLEEAIHIDNTNKWYKFTLAQAYQLQKKYDKAVKVFEELYQMYPYDEDIIFGLADYYLMNREPLKAIKLYDKMEILLGVTPEISNEKKKLWLSMNKFDNAVNEIQKLIQAYPDNTDYIRTLIDLYLANNKQDLVLDLYKKILSIDSNDGRAALVLADYYIRNNQTSLGHSYSVRAMKNTDLDVESKLTFLLLNYVKRGLTPYNKIELFDLVDLVIKSNTSRARPYAFKGDVYFEFKEADSALKYYNKALEEEKSMLLLWKKIVLLDFDKKKYRDAITVCDQSFEYFPNNPEMYFYKGIALMQLKEYGKATEALETGIKYVINNNDLEQQYYSNLAESYNELAEYEKSDHCFDKALQLDPRDAIALNNYAYYLSVRKTRLDDAEKMSMKSIDLNPNSAANLDTYGWILYLKGDFSGARKQIEKALSLQPNDPDILEHYGDILYKSGDVEKAVIQWNKAKSNGSVSRFLDQKIQDKKLYE